MLELDKLTFSYQDLDWPLSEEIFKKYITYAYEFFLMDTHEFIHMLNRLYESLDDEKVRRLLFSLSYVQYVAEQTSPKDRTLKTLALIGLIEEVSKLKFEGGNKQRFKLMLNTYLDFVDKKRLVQSYGFGKNFQRVCFDDCLAEDEIACYSCDFHSPENIDGYSLKVLDKIYKIRCSVVHDSLLSLVTEVGADAYSDDGQFELYCSNITFLDFKEMITNAVKNLLNGLESRSFPSNPISNKSNH